jgi:hypothetical protein
MRKTHPDKLGENTPHDMAELIRGTARELIKRSKKFTTKNVGEDMRVLADTIEQEKSPKEIRDAIHALTKKAAHAYKASIGGRNSYWSKKRAVRDISTLLAFTKHYVADLEN